MKYLSLIARWAIRFIYAACIIALLIANVQARVTPASWGLSEPMVISGRYPTAFVFGGGGEGRVSSYMDKDYEIYELSMVRIVVRAKSITGRYPGSYSSMGYDPPPTVRGMGHAKACVLLNNNGFISVWWYPPDIYSIRVASGESFIVRNGQVEVGGVKAKLAGNLKYIMIDGYECKKFP